MRIQEEMKISKSATFLTLTYSDENIPLIVDKSTGELKKTLYKKHVQLYFKKVRKTTPNLRYYAVGEYGNLGRPHYHAIVFNADNRLLTNKWDNGFTRCDTCNDSTIHYVTKYIINEEEPDNTKQKPFSLISKGLGLNYVETTRKYYTDNQSTTAIRSGGVKTLLPRYYREKIFSKEERKAIGKKNWLQASESLQMLEADFIRSQILAKKIKASKSSKSKKC